MPKTITGPGTYTTTQVLSNPTLDNPATVTATGIIDVNSTIANTVGLYGSAGTAWTITNLGTVESVGSLGIGIKLASGGAVTNGSSGATSALIDGKTGLEMFGAVGTVNNY